MFKLLEITIVLQKQSQQIKDNNHFVFGSVGLSRKLPKGWFCEKHFRLNSQKDWQGALSAAYKQVDRAFNEIMGRSDKYVNKTGDGFMITAGDENFLVENNANDTYISLAVKMFGDKKPEKINLDLIEDGKDSPAEEKLKGVINALMTRVS